MEWLKNGERNTKFFNTIFNGRRSRFKVNRIQYKEGEQMEQQKAIVEETVDFYRKQFTVQEDNKGD